MGIERAGYNTIFCIEKDPNCFETLTSNQPLYFQHSNVIHADINDIDILELMRQAKLRPGQLELLFGGPPCQSFSQIGKRDSLADERGRLLFKMVDFARALRPKAVLIENVKALSSAKDSSGRRGGVLAQLKLQFEDMGYIVSHAVLNSSDFGVAQKRQRLFFIATIGKRAFDFSTAIPENNQKKNVADAIFDLPAPQRKGHIPTVHNHLDVTPAGDINRIRLGPVLKYGIRKSVEV